VVWQDAPVKPPSVMQEAELFMRAFRKRALRDVVTSVLMTAVFLLIALTTRVFWVQIGAGLATVGSVVSVWWAFRGRPAPIPSAADPLQAYQHLLDDALTSAKTAAWWTVFPLIPGTALIGIGLATATLPFAGEWTWVAGLCAVVLLGLLACWRLMWHTRSQHAAELMARREALNDHLYVE
jgi:hypothetical protein